MLDPQSLPAAEAGSRHVKQGDQSGPTSGLFLCLGLDCWVRGWVLWRVLAAVEPAPSLLGSECRRRWTTTLSSVCRASSVHHALSFVWMASLAWTCFETLMRYESRLFCSGGSVRVMPVVARVVSLGAFLIGDLACRWVIMSVCLGRWWSLAEASRRSKSLGFAGFYFETWLVSRLESCRRHVITGWPLGWRRRRGVLPMAVRSIAAVLGWSLGGPARGAWGFWDGSMLCPSP